MLHIIEDLQDQLISLIKDDPVRPEIPAEFRVDQNGRIFVLQNEQGEPTAVTCVKFLAEIPESVEDLARFSSDANTAVFYTIWSYAAGSGRELITEAKTWIESNYPSIGRFVTLSPKTEMARRFHHKNGAETLRENPDTVNYVYR